MQDGCGPNNYDYERRMRQLRRRMREAAADWTWLAACMGVVEGDMNPVEAYLNGGGDPTRKLTNPEASSHSRTHTLHDQKARLSVTISRNLGQAL